MKTQIVTIMALLWAITTSAQPRPFEIDPSFAPTSAFMQKTWTGAYDGLEPTSRITLSVSRVLVLNLDFTYTNEVRCLIKDKVDDVLMKYETGTYQYDTDTHTLNYVIKTDSTLDIKILLQGTALTYVSNHYEQAKTSTEEVLFTYAATDEKRQWVLFDQMLRSPVDSRQPVVYVMDGMEAEPSGVTKPRSTLCPAASVYYDLNGRSVSHPVQGLYIRDGKKIILKRNH